MQANEFPRWLNPKLKMKEITKCYEKEIEEIEGSEQQDDEITKLLGGADGVPGSVR